MAIPIKVKFTPQYKDFPPNVREIEYLPEKHSWSKEFSFNEYVEQVSVFLSAPPEWSLHFTVPYDMYPVFVKGGQEGILMGFHDYVVPGIYEVGLFKGDQQVDSLTYLIIPTSGEYDDILQLRETLESIVRDLARDITRQGYTSLSKGLFYNESLLEKVRILYENNEKINRCIQDIINNPISELTKSGVITYKTKRLSARSISWLASKGYQYNEIPQMPDIILSEHVSLTSDVFENRVLKAVLMKIIENISNIENKIFELIDAIQKYYDKKYDTYNNWRVKYDQINGAVGLERKKHYLRKQKESAYDELGDIENRIKSLRSNFLKVRGVKLAISNAVYNSFISDLKVDYNIRLSAKTLKNPSYLFLHDLLLRIETGKDNISNSNIFTYQFKPTDKLLEYYCVCMICNILSNDLQFQWKSGWLADCAIPSCELTDNTSLCFADTKKNVNVRILYDYIVPYYNDIQISSKDYDQIITKNLNEHNRPDIIVEFFDGESLHILKTVIFECKHRKSKYLYNKNSTTDVHNQIASYATFGYRRNNCNQLAAGDIKVNCLYTSGRIHVDCNDALVNYIPIKFAIDFKSVEGYSEVLKQIKQIYDELPLIE